MSNPFSASAAVAFAKYVGDQVINVVGDHMEEQALAAGRLLAEMVNPLAERIKALEAALCIKRDEETARVEAAAKAFVEDAPAPTLADLNERAEQHKQTMKAK